MWSITVFNTGRRQKAHSSKRPTANPRETKTGRMTVRALNDAVLPPRLEIIWTITKPTTSSITAALVVTVPRRVVVSWVVERMVKVVPRLVALSAAPAANAWSDVADTSSFKMKDSPIGTPIPVRATAVERRMFALRDLIEVDRPPVYVRLYVVISKSVYTYLHKLVGSTLDSQFVE